MPTAYQIKDQSTPHYLTFQVVCCLSLFQKNRQGHHRQRITQQYTQGSNTIAKLWAGACEYINQNGQQKTLTYLSGPEGVFALHVQYPAGTENIRYIHKDHLGSWNTITDENGNLLQELSFDAWGTRRNPVTWRAFTGTPPEPLFDRGFTGHEHLYGFQLINMNGRMYDPLVSRMLSPDNFIQAPDFSQSFNRYSYVWNNPLVYTDPSGEVILPVLYGMLTSGAMHFLQHVVQHGSLDNWNWGNFAGAMLAGGISGYLGPHLSNRGIGGAYGGSVLGASAGLVGSVSSGIINNNLKINNILKSTLGGGFLGGGIGAIDASLRGQRWYDGRHPKSHKRYHVFGSQEPKKNKYWTDERLREKNAVHYQESNAHGLPRSKKIDRTYSNKPLKQNYDGPLTIAGTTYVPEGTEFYISIDGVETVFTSGTQFTMPVPLSFKTIEWGFRGEQVIRAEDIFRMNNGGFYINQPVFPETSITISGDFRPWRGFLFW